MHGNIAAGSSSGGLLLKNPGRIGPAALVNVGTSVLPVDPDDEDQRCVAVAVSGTGERMLTTTLARRCAERTYDCVRKVKLPGGKGTVLEECTEDEALASVINNEFMGHPGVAHSGFGSAIGVMGVKMERRGIAFFFGHTAESFAVASMHADDIEPQVLVSRINKNEKGKKKDQISVLQGGRLYPFRKKRTKAAEGASPSHTRSTKANQSAAEGNMKAKG
ncbi:asparaginase [Ascosphaera apis ARSEF 7405]|uniref:Asparaginase n=1 Tax=Ascosphaera apis ARSEF 7405 TaxID=392613 RepID=A0A167X1J5_9EURO|nr:asparaginase [Ascosphaera apis ARSEF 7405]